MTIASGYRTAARKASNETADSPNARRRNGRIDLATTKSSFRKKLTSQSSIRSAINSVFSTDVSNDNEVIKNYENENGNVFIGSEKKPVNLPFSAHDSQVTESGEYADIDIRQNHQILEHFSSKKKHRSAPLINKK